VRATRIIIIAIIEKTGKNIPSIRNIKAVQKAPGDSLARFLDNKTPPITKNINQIRKNNTTVNAGISRKPS